MEPLVTVQAELFPDPNRGGLWTTRLLVCINDDYQFVFQDVLKKLEAKGISIRVASPKLVMEEAPERNGIDYLTII